LLFLAFLSRRISCSAAILPCRSPRRRWHRSAPLAAGHLKAWREPLIADEDLEAKQKHDPAAPAKRSEAALQKVLTHTLSDGTPTHSFRTLLEDLGTIVRNTCVTRSAQTPSPTFTMITTANATQQRALARRQSNFASEESVSPNGRCSCCNGSSRSQGISST
jgi:hypothetical protein